VAPALSGVGATAMSGDIPTSRWPGKVAHVQLRSVDSRTAIQCFSHPYVLHYPGNSFPTDTPRPQLNTWTLQKYSNNTVFDNELWGANFGVLR
jgi:hypothetical protein